MILPNYVLHVFSFCACSIDWGYPSELMAVKMFCLFLIMVFLRAQFSSRLEGPHRSFFGFGYLLKSKFIVNGRQAPLFLDTAISFRCVTKGYFFGFQATAVAMAMVMQGYSFYKSSIKFMISKFSQSLHNETLKM